MQEGLRFFGNSETSGKKFEFSLEFCMSCMEYVITGNQMFCSLSDSAMSNLKLSFNVKKCLVSLDGQCWFCAWTGIF